MYSDSEIVHGYLHYEQRQYSKYITCRVSFTLSHAPKNTWHYLNTRENPADLATRATVPESLKESIWLTGPKFLHAADYEPAGYDNSKTPVLLKEEIKTVSAMVTSPTQSKSSIFVRINKLNHLVRVFKQVVRCINLLKRKIKCTPDVCEKEITRDDALTHGEISTMRALQWCY